MIAKQVKGSGFRGVLNYMDAKVKDGVGELIYSNMLSDNPRGLAKEFGMIRSFKPNVSKSVYHCALSINPEEQLTNEQFCELASEYLDEMGFSNSQYVIYRHTDRDHPHIHIVANRINLDGAVVSDKWDYKRSEEIVRRLEQKYELKQTVSSDKSKASSLSKGQVEKFRRTGEVPIKAQLQVIVNSALEDSATLQEFCDKVKEYGADVELHTNSNDKVYGVSFELDGIAMKGSSLGRAYSLNKIIKQINQNNERNKGLGKEIGTGTVGNIESTSREFTEIKPGQYPRDERSIASNNDGYERHGGKHQAGNDKRAGTTGNSPEEYTGNASNDNSSFGETERVERSEGYDTNKDLSDCDTDRDNSRDVYIPNPSIQTIRSSEDEDDLKKKKKKKRIWLGR